MTAATADRRAWQTWLDGLAEAAARLEAQLAAGEVLSFPDLAAPPLGPDSPGADSPGLPGELLVTATHLLDRLERLERVAQIQRDGLAIQLQSLAAPRPRPTTVPNYELGRALDVAG